MEKLICAIVRNYRKMMDYWMTETKWGFKRAAIALMTPFIIGAIMMKFNETIAVKVGLLSMVIFGLLWLFMYLDSGTKFVHFISRGKYDNPRQLLQNMTHLSYIYGIIISINVEYIIFFIVCVIEIILGREVYFPNIEILFCIIFFAFSFFYFAFHLYINPKKIELTLEIYDRWYEKIKVNLSEPFNVCLNKVLIRRFWEFYFKYPPMLKRKDRQDFYTMMDIRKQYITNNPLIKKNDIRAILIKYLPAKYICQLTKMWIKIKS